MPSYTQRSLATLRDRRIDEERQAERALAGALAAQREAEAETARLDARVGVARAALEDARGVRPAAQSASAAQAERSFWARRQVELADASSALATHRAGPLAAAVGAAEDARAACARARQRREVVDKAIARREAVARREAERRAEAEIDDRAPGPRPRPRST
jgi:hypothetical protein